MDNAEGLLDEIRHVSKKQGLPTDIFIKDPQSPNPFRYLTGTQLFLQTFLSIGTMREWGIGYLRRDASLVASLEPYIDRNVLGGVLLGCLVLSLSYPALESLFMCNSTTYRLRLTAEQRVVVIQHTIEALFFGLCFLPTTYLVLDFNFRPHTAEEMGPKVTISTVFLGLVVILYCLEVNSRSCHIRPILLIHHVGACLVGVFSAFVFTETTVITSSLLVYFISFEAIIFAGLVTYRLGCQHAPRVLWIGMSVFGASRPLQLLMVLASLWANRDHIVLWQGIASLCITVLFTALQLYTLTIHYRIYGKCRHWPESPSDSHFDGAIAKTGQLQARADSLPAPLYSMEVPRAPSSGMINRSMNMA